MQLTSALHIYLYGSKDLVYTGSDSSQCCLTSEFIEVLQSTEITCIADNCFVRYTELSWILYVVRTRNLLCWTLHVVRKGNLFNYLLVSGTGEQRENLSKTH